MNNTPKTVESVIDQLLYDITTKKENVVPKAITALNELIRNERIDELEIQPLFSDKVEQAEYENNRIAELRAEERLQK